MVVIAVTGSASRSLPPERGTVRLRVVGEGAEPAAAVGIVRPVLERLSADARGFEGDGSATRWSVQSIATSVEERYGAAGERPERVHLASAPVSVRFRSAEALMRWVGALVDEPAVQVEGVAWTLTSETRLAVERELRAAAVRDAVERANDYAAALGLGEVRVVRLWEAGLRPSGGDGWTAQALGRSAAGAGIALHPSPVEVVVEITAETEAA